MTDIHIAGAFAIPFRKAAGVGLRDLAAEAVRGVLADAGAGAQDVDAVFFANASEGHLTGQHAIRGQIALQGTGLLGAPIVNVENACASGSTAVHLAAAAIRAGDADLALAIGAEKLSHEDRGKTFSVFSSGWDVERFGAPDPASTQSGFMDIYASMAEQYMARSGATAADFAAVSVKSHANGRHNPVAQYRDPLTVEQVLASRAISGPLTLLMCSPVSDGAAALLLASPTGLERLGRAADVRLLASALRSGDRLDGGGTGVAVARAATAAYEAAGLGPEDVDVAEVHDAAAPGELIVYEDLGLAAEGEGPELLRSGATSLGGRVPVNPSGGLLSRGHPVGATGCAQLVELTDQLRGRAAGRQVDGARIGIAENGGGWIGADVAAVVVSIVGR